MSEVITKLEDLKDKYIPDEDQNAEEDTQVPAEAGAEKPDLADRLYQKHCERKLKKAQKKELKAERKEAKKAEKQTGKKISGKTIGIVAAGVAVAGIVGKALLDTAASFNQDQSADSCTESGTCTDGETTQETNPEVSANNEA